MEQEYTDEEIGKYAAKKNDCRLFPEYPLYCEGFHRPKCRGLFHSFCSILLALLGYYHYYLATKGFLPSIIIACLYLSTNLFCYGISGLYHMGRWSPTVEILLQKLDHCGIAILSTGTMLPVSFLVLPLYSGLCLIGLTALFCIWTCYNIFQLKPSVTRQALTAGVLLLFVPTLYYLFTPLEFATMISTFILQIIGMVIFIHEPNEKDCTLCCCCPSLYGYHEVFHVFVVSAGICVYVCNYSIIERTAGQLIPGTAAEVLYNYSSSMLSKSSS